MKNFNFIHDRIKIIIIVFLLFLTFSPKINAQVSFGSSKLINDNWYFTLSNPKNAQQEEIDTNNWRKLDLPHDWSIEGNYSSSLASCTGYLPGGIGWYRKTIDLSNLQKDKKVYLYFEGVYNRSEVYINGQLVGKRPNGYISFMYDITPFINFSDDNVIAVKVDHSRSADSRWYTGSGIYRNVYLITSGKVHFCQWGVSYTTPEVSSKNATIRTTTEIKNETNEIQDIKLINVLTTSKGVKKAFSEKSVKVEPNSVYKDTDVLKIKNPVLWDIKNPYLYSLDTRILKGTDKIDETKTSVGIRSIKFDANEGFSLNGFSMKIKGVCIHHDAGCLGSAVPKEVWERRFIKLKSLGCNAIRLSHNPQSPDVYELCDNLGLLVMDEAFDEWEFPKRKWIVGWNKGKPGYEGTYDYFKQWSDRDIVDMVKRDRNHPSVIMWSIGNEVDYPNDPYSHPVLNHGKINQKVYGGYLPESPKAERLGVIAKRLSSDVRKVDTSRPVTAALAGVIMSNETEYPGCLDITGYNYTENRYDLDHKKYPQRVIYGSENSHNMEAWNDMKNRDFISAQFLWTGIDYLGESGAWPARGGNGGLLNYAGFIKPRGYYRSALWNRKPVAYIGTTTLNSKTGTLIRNAWPVWNYKKGELVKILVFTNSAKAKLLLNGKQVGDIKDYDNKTGVIYWEIPFEPGILRVVGLDNSDKEQITYEIKTSKRPYSIICHPYLNTISCNKRLSQIEINIVDEDGNPVVLSNNDITCTISGPGKLLGLEAGDDHDMGNYHDNKQRVYKGKLIAYIQATDKIGNIEVTFTSPGLKTSKCIIP